MNKLLYFHYCLIIMFTCLPAYIHVCWYIFPTKAVGPIPCNETVMFSITNVSINSVSLRLIHIMCQYNVLPHMCNFSLYPIPNQTESAIMCS